MVGECVSLVILFCYFGFILILLMRRVCGCLVCVLMLWIVVFKCMSCGLKDGEFSGGFYLYVGIVKGI